MNTDNFHWQQTIYYPSSSDPISHSRLQSGFNPHLEMSYITTLQSGLPYSGKFLKVKTFVNFAVLWLFAKVLSAKYWGVVFFGMEKASNP